MASRLASRKLIRLYRPSLACVVRQFCDTPESTILGFTQANIRYPFPGNIGPSIVHTEIKSEALPSLEDNEDKEVDVNTILDSHKAFPNAPLLEVMNEVMEESLGPTMDDYLELVAQECPTLFKTDVAELFNSVDFEKMDNLTVITISKRTEHDMTGWDEDVELEREELLHSFINGAADICEALNGSGYWADFIDPSSGKPFYGTHTNSTFFETDERYRNLGFEIEDLGCCKVIKHHLWGSHSYVGAIFTNAPLNDPIIANIRK